MDVKVLGRIRKVLEGIDAEAVGNNDEQIALTQQLEVLVAAGAAPYSEIVRGGHAFYVTGNPLAAVVAIPTTAVMAALYNMEPDGGRSLIIDWVSAIGIAKTAAAGQAFLLGNLGQIREAIPADGGFLVKKANGLGSSGSGGQGDSRARTVTAALPVATGASNNWIPLGPAVGFPGAAATPGHALYANVDGRLIVAPGRYFAMHVLADVVGSTFLPCIGWHETQLTLA